MLISILMPVKNEEAFLKEALDSLMAQSESQFELIAVDDGSNDKSLAILKSFASKDKRIRVFENTGNGVIEALQLAYSFATGQLITRQDADDVMPVNKLQELKKVLMNHGPGAISTGLVTYFSQQELGEGFKNYALWLNGLCENKSHDVQLYKECVIASSNWLMYRQDLQKIGAFENLVYPEDYHMVFRLFENHIKIISSPQVTHHWRDHPARASRTSDLYKDQKFYPLKVEYFLRLQGADKLNLWGAGPSGKQLAKELLSKNVSFDWLTNNPKKIGQEIYGVKLQHFDCLKERSDEKLIISVTQRGAVTEIKKYLEDIEFKNYFEF